MIRSLSGRFLPILVASVDEVEDFITRSANLLDKDEVMQFSGEWREDCTQKKAAILCQGSSALGREDPQDLQQNIFSCNNLYVFVSFSLPLESWSQLSCELEKVGGSFVLKGIPDNSFQLFSEKLLELRQAGVVAPIQINPDLYVQYRIEAIPAMILEGPYSYDKVTGNIGLRASLELFTEHGSTCELAKNLLGKLAFLKAQNSF